MIRNKFCPLLLPPPRCFFFCCEKVSENSLAEQAGMKFGDIIVRINDTPASNLSHLEAHNVLLAAGNNFMIGVKR